MEKIGNYEVWKSASYSQTAAAAGKKDEVKTAQAQKEERASKTDKVNLSTGARNLLKELQKKYGNMDFIVADYETDEEAASYLSRSTGEYSLLITPDELEKMASDESVKDENLKMLDSAIDRLAEMKTQLGDKGQDISRIGIAVRDNGEVSYFAELEKVSEKQRERIEKQREGRKEEAARAEKKEQKAVREKELSFGTDTVKRTRVYASSVSELAEKIEKVDWSAVKDEKFAANGSHFDITT